MEKIKIGLFGVGYFGNFHLINILKTRFELIGFYDSDVNKSELISKKYGISNFKNAFSLIEECDAIDITTPTINHFKLIEKAIELGKHVFVEKPITTNYEEAMAIKEKSNYSDTIIQVGHIERFNPVIQNLDLDEHQIINIEANRFSTYNTRGTDVSVVFDLMIHDIDIVLKLMGKNILNINANGFKKYGSYPEFVSASLFFENGSKATLNASIIHPYLERKMKIWTKEKYLELDLSKKHTEIFSLKNLPDNKMNILESKESREYITNNSILDELNEFYECIVNGRMPRVSLSDGVDAIEVAEMINKKIKI
ncbi:MAG: Gfo/Idh/MocA family protein [Deltaproteobacteria bacterium]